MVIKTLQAVVRKGAGLLKKAQNRQRKQGSQQSKQKQATDKTSSKQAEQKESSVEQKTNQEQLKQRIQDDPSLRKQVDEVKAKNLNVQADNSDGALPTSANDGNYVPNRQRSLSLDDKGGPAL